MEPTYQLNVVYRIDGGAEGINTLSFTVYEDEAEHFTVQHESDRTAQVRTTAGAIVSLLVDRIIYAEALPITPEA